MGYYGGRGARAVTTLGPFQGRAQTVPTAGTKNLHECQWAPAIRFSVPGDWLSGVYLGRLTTVVEGDTEPYWQSYVVFIVRDDRPADILLQCSDNTWQGLQPLAEPLFALYPSEGKSGSLGRRQLRSSLWPRNFNMTKWSMIRSHLAPRNSSRSSSRSSTGSSNTGVDVTYCSNSDMLSPDRGLRCKSIPQRRPRRILGDPAIPQRRADAGPWREPAVFLWQRWLAGSPLIATAAMGRAQPDHFSGRPLWALITTTQRRQKENGLLPEHGPDEGLLSGGRNVEPVNGGGDWVVAKAGALDV